MQERRSRRAAAAFGAALLIVVGWFGAWHEAEVAHVRDGRGELVHAHELAELHHDGPAAHLHGRHAHEHLPGACALLAVAHATTVAARAIAPDTIPPIPYELAATQLAAVHGAIARYRLAPKTSPPAMI
jgi:hypothetical protein